MKTKQITISRAYDVSPEDKGFRVLVDRLWPRGVSKESLALDEWFKNIAPSAELRKWFNHRDDRWEEFRKRYIKELTENTDDEVTQLLEIAKKHPLLLIYSARDEEHNNAVILKEFLLKKAKK